MAMRPDLKRHVARKAAHAGEHVGFKYRSAKHPEGTVVGTAKGGTKSDPMLDIRPDKSSRHKGEPAVIHRRESKVHAE